MNAFEVYVKTSVVLVVLASSLIGQVQLRVAANQPLGYIAPANVASLTTGQSSLSVQKLANTTQAQPTCTPCGTALAKPYVGTACPNYCIAPLPVDPQPASHPYPSPICDPCRQGLATPEMMCPMVACIKVE